MLLIDVLILLYLILLFMILEKVSSQPTCAVKPAYLRHHADWTYTHFFLAFLPLPFWSLMVKIVNQNLATNVTSTKSNPLKVTSVAELIRFYGKCVLFFSLNY